MGVTILERAVLVGSQFVAAVGGIPDAEENHLSEPILLFLHGVGDGDPEDKWRKTLDLSLRALGHPTLDDARVIAPKFPRALKFPDDGKHQVPPVTLTALRGDAARANRRDFEQRTAAIEFRLGHGDSGEPGVVQRSVDAAIADAALAAAPFKQARNYLDDPEIRARVLGRVLDALPRTGSLVIVGHSLGSVIAADILPRLPEGIEVVGMVTIGSPLAGSRFDLDRVRATLADPPAHLGWWVNFWNDADQVASHRGLSSVFPWLLDRRIHTGSVGIGAHYAVDYLADEAVAEAIGFAMFGSTSRAVAARETVLDIPADAVELMTALRLRFAHLLRPYLAKDVEKRFVGAARTVQANAVEELRQRSVMLNRPLPNMVGELDFDLSDPGSIIPEPSPARHLPKDEAVVALTLLATDNPVRPFDINVSNESMGKALRDLSAEMGLGSSFGADVLGALEETEVALRGKKGAPWLKWAALGVGAAALVIVTGGMALAVTGAGLAGAAAITSALAAFGPGGMIGGLATAGTLATVGGGGIAFGLASATTSAETLEVVVLRQVAAALVRQKQGLDQDPNTWAILVETEIAVRREHERLDEFSDPGSSTLKALKRKIDVVGRALALLRDRGLSPTASTPAN